MSFVIFRFFVFSIKYLFFKIILNFNVNNKNTTTKLNCLVLLEEMFKINSDFAIILYLIVCLAPELSIQIKQIVIICQKR